MLFLRKFAGLNINLSGTLKVTAVFKNFSNFFTQQGFYPFLKKPEKFILNILTYPKSFLNLLLTWSLIRLREQSLQIDLLIKILMKYIQFNQ